MPLPRVNYQEQDNSSVPVASLAGAHGIIVPTLLGPSDQPYLVKSVDQLKALFGVNNTINNPLFPQMRRALKRGVSLWIQRLVATGATSATYVMLTAAADSLVHLTAKSVGSWANASLGITFHKSTGGGDPFVLNVTLASNSAVNEIWSAVDMPTLAGLVNNPATGSKLLSMDLGAGYTIPDTIASTVFFSSGTDGSFANPAAKDAAINALLANFNSLTGIDTISAPGTYTLTTMQNLLTYALGRQDLTGAFEIDPSLTPDAALTFAQAITFSGQDASWIEGYWGSNLSAWSPEDQTYVTGPVLLDVLGVFSYNDTVGARYQAPAGANRGLIPNVQSFAYNMLSPGNSVTADALVTAGINIVGADVNFGPAVWGERTMNLKGTSLDYIHVRRMMIDLKGQAVPILKSELFEPMNPTTWRIAYGKIKVILDELVRANAIYPGWVYIGDQDASTIQDALYNQPNDLANNIYKVKIRLVAQGYIDQLDVTAELDALTVLFNVTPAA